MTSRRAFPEKRQKRQKSLRKKVYKSDATNTVLSHAFPSTFISQRCFLRIWGVANYILMDRKTATSLKQIEICLFLNRRCVFFVVLSRELYVKLFISILEYIKQKVA